MTKTFIESHGPAAMKDEAAASSPTRSYAATVLAPLDHEEATQAIERALDQVLHDKATRRERLTIYGPFLRIEKPTERGGPPRRMVWVRVRDRDRGIVHEVFSESGNIVENVRHGASNLAFSDQEQDEALRVLSADAQLGKLVVLKDVEIEWFNAGESGRARVMGARLVRVKDNRVVEEITAAEVDIDTGVLRPDKEPR